MLTGSLLAVSFPDDVFAEIAVTLLVSALAGLVAVRLHQPLAVAYVAVGVFVGPSVLGVVQPGSELELFAELGVALLLFVVGLKLDLHVVRTLAPSPSSWGASRSRSSRSPAS
jgi:Kef-type K+ transport system membrane component KefB